MKHFLDTQDFSRGELLRMMALIGLLKRADKQGALPPLLAGASLGMIFEEPSTRTRVSFEVAMTKLGGHALYLKPGEIHLGERENIKDTSQVISRMVDAIEARTLKNKTLLDLAANATVPVINGLTDYNHPTQVVCDVFTMLEHKLPEKELSDLRVVFIGDATNVCASLLMMCTRMGMHFTHVAPPKYQAPEAWQRIGRENCAVSGGSLTISDDPVASVRDADFIYTDLWWWVGQEAEIPERRAAFMPRYQVNLALFEAAPPHARMMHCLPASRGVEATDAVLDHPRSIIYDQSENRLHTEKAILVTFIHPRLRKPPEALRQWHAGQIHSFLSEPALESAP
ncbi:MAG: putrescine carbamoyltransferase [Arenimonas sp.]|uniref:putrescine carbamoyltransferase n=1 Tax=Arenimonas sp. TaxID=1872635 RepID=UPI0025B98D4C|nr:putrescine carbamoyltransferase [Arenimonas sp.]MBW8369034.1 putrescine carbamoyltransferase [Arenimonas sp.]